jgi:hypothetical protein
MCPYRGFGFLKKVDEDQIQFLRQLSYEMGFDEDEVEICAYVLAGFDSLRKGF